MGLVFYEYVMHGNVLLLNLPLREGTYDQSSEIHHANVKAFAFVTVASICKIFHI